MNYLTEDFFKAWREGGLRAYCYLEATARYALARGDFVAAAELDFLTDVMDQRMALEVIHRMRALAREISVTPTLQVLVA